MAFFIGGFGFIPQAGNSASGPRSPSPHSPVDRQLSCGEEVSVIRTCISSVVCPLRC